MDANDVEMTMKRPRKDTDEVYPIEELEDDYLVYQPATRRQNRWFALATVGLMSALGAAFGARVYKVPASGEDVQWELHNVQPDSDEQGTVSNNADNAHSKVSEALRNHNQMPAKKPHSRPWAQDPSVQGDPVTPELDPTNSTTVKTSEGEPNKPISLGDQWKAWHELQVSKGDGQMFEVVEVLSHDPKSFTEGLTYDDESDKLYESIGLNGQSKLLVLNPNTGETLESYTMESTYFAEGLTNCHGQLYQLTYKAKKGFIYDMTDLGSKPTEFDYETTTGEGWGFTYDKDHDEFIVSDGSAFLHFWDRQTLKQVRKHQIMRLDGSKAKHINELEYWRGRVVANVWYENVILIINPVSGLVEKEYDFDNIWKAAGQSANNRAEVFNGISVSRDPDVLYVTGKWWSKMFKIKLLPEIPSS